MSWCALNLGKVYSHVAALLFKLEAACRLGYTNPSRTLLPCKWNQSFKTEVRFYYMWRHQLLTYDIVTTQVTPAELFDIEFVKPKHSKNSKHQVFCQPRGWKLLVAHRIFSKIKTETLHMSWCHNFLLMLRRGIQQNDHVRKSRLQVQMDKQRNKFLSRLYRKTLNITI